MACVYTPCGAGTLDITLAANTGEIQATPANCASGTYDWSNSSAYTAGSGSDAVVPDAPNGSYQTTFTCTDAGANDSCITTDIYVCNITLTLGISPTDNEVLEGTADASDCGTTYTYSWYKDSVLLSGETSTSLTWSTYGPGQYTFRALCDDDGCFNEKTVTISNLCEEDCHYQFSATLYHLDDIHLGASGSLSDYSSYFTFPYSELEVNMDQFQTDLQDWLDDYDDCYKATAIVTYDEGTDAFELFIESSSSTFWDQIEYRETVAGPTILTDISQNCCGSCGGDYINENFAKDYSNTISPSTYSGGNNEVISFIVNGQEYLPTPTSFGALNQITYGVTSNYVTNEADAINTAINTYFIPGNFSVSYSDNLSTGGSKSNEGRFINIQYPDCYEWSITLDYTDFLWLRYSNNGFEYSTNMGGLWNSGSYIPVYFTNVVDDTTPTSTC